MGRYFALTLNIPQKEKAKPRTGMKINFGFWILALIIVFGVLYLFQVNSLSTKGYETRALERRVQELKESNTKLELEAAGLKSVHSIQEQVRTLNLVPSGAVKYLGETDFAYQR